MSAGKKQLFTKKVTPSVENRFRPIDGDLDKTIAKIIEFAEAYRWIDISGLLIMMARASWGH